MWTTVSIKEQDLYKRDVWGWKENNPTLVRVGKKFFCTLYETNVQFKDNPLNKRKVCTVDLGMNHSAVCNHRFKRHCLRKEIHKSSERKRLFVSFHEQIAQSTSYIWLDSSPELLATNRYPNQSTRNGALPRNAYFTCESS